MSASRPRADAGAVVAAVLRLCGVGLVLLASCGGAASDSQIGVTPRPAVTVAGWPPLATSPAEGMTVTSALSAADGAQIRVRAYLVLLSPPCPACNIGGQRGGTTSSNEEDRIGRTARPRGPDMPGCSPCPAASATFGDETPIASRPPASASLRAVGSAEGLQARHVGHMFLLTGTFHANGASGPELEVSDVRAVEGN